MANTNFNTSNDTFRQLIGNGLSYLVPLFQRDYSWTENEWDDLWQDIFEIYKEKSQDAHYMGYLVLQSSDSKKFDIIDGQQRITTLSILALAVLKNLQILQEKGVDPEKNKKREDQIRSTFIGYLDPVTLISRSKLKLNKHNDYFYQNYMTTLRDMPRSGLKTSEKLLKQSLEWFIKKIQNEISNNNGEELARFIDDIADKLFFTKITVTDELNAFKVFETLNARGVRLSSTDLLKNYLFSVVNSANSHESEMHSLEISWGKIVNKLGGDSFPDYLRAFWNSKNKLVRKSELFKTIKKQISNMEQVFSLIRELEDNLDIYTAFGHPEDEFWTQEQKKYIKELKMFNIRQPFSLLMIACKKFNEEDFTKLLRACSIISFRYNVICGLNPNEQENVYNKTANLIAHSNKLTINEVIDNLKDVYPEDSRFGAAFEEKELNTTGGRQNKIAKYILFEIEKQLSNQDYEIDSDKYSLEHILPENPDETWAEYEESRDEKYIYRLGNFTLLTKTENKDIGNKNFEIKKLVYKNSQFEITKKITDYEDWNIEKIANRQKKLAKTAKTVWKLNSQ